MPRSSYQSQRSSFQYSYQLRRLGGRDEELHLHLLELARAEDEVAGRDLVAERLADLRDAERRLLAAELQDVLEVDEDALRRLRAQVGDRRGLLHRADDRLEHEVEVARLGELVAAVLGLGQVRLRRAHLVRVEVVGAEALLARAAVDERVGEAGEVAAGLPHARVLEDRRVERDDVVALLEHRAPPLVLDVRLQQDAVVAVVVRRAEAAVDLRATGRRSRAACRARRSCPWSRRRRASARIVDCRAAMPIYEYRRPDGTTFEVMQKMSDDPLTHDPETGVPVERVFQPDRHPLQGQGLLQHRLRDEEAQPREGERRSPRPRSNSLVGLRPTSSSSRVGLVGLVLVVLVVD